MTNSSHLNIREHVSLRDFTTFRIGGPARFFCEVLNEAELTEAFAFVREHSDKKNGVQHGLPIFILAGGSNILISDEGFDGLVIKMNIHGVHFDEVSANSEIFVVSGAGENWDEFVGECVKHGLAGLENLSGIPGTVGAAPVQNIGAYGVEVARSIQSVRVFDTEDSSWKVFSKAECEFEYRDSIFKKTKNKNGGARYIITSVTFALKKFISADATPLDINYKDVAEYFSNAHVSPASTPADVRTAIVSIRTRKLPDVRVIGTAGSFFKNPIISEDHYFGLKKTYPDIPGFVAGDGVMKVPLAWILDHICGYRGVLKGNVGTYKNQALVIVNHFLQTDSVISGATASEIKAFADTIIAMVKEKTSIDIEPEVQYV